MRKPLGKLHLPCSETLQKINFVFLTIKVPWGGGWGNGPIHKILAVQIEGPDFESSESTEKLCMVEHICNSTAPTES